MREDDAGHGFVQWIDVGTLLPAPVGRALFSATAARMSALNAFASMSSPS